MPLLLASGNCVMLPEAYISLLSVLSSVFVLYEAIKFRFGKTVFQIGLKGLLNLVDFKKEMMSLLYIFKWF